MVLSTATVIPADVSSGIDSPASSRRFLRNVTLVGVAAQVVGFALQMIAAASALVLGDGYALVALAGTFPVVLASVLASRGGSRARAAPG